MRKRLYKILVTGGAGFIGSEFVRQGVKKGYKIVVVDCLTYAGDLDRLNEVKDDYKFYKTSICNKLQIASIFKKERPQKIIHFAAESDVDRSILDASSFIDTNVKGTQILLDESRKNGIKRFIHISTDEVYGDIKRGNFKESSPLNPSSPYAASKAAADCLVKSYIRTYNFPGIIVRPSNNFGPWQYPEKFIPVAIHKVLSNDKIPVYARGMNKREWLYVSDCVEAIFQILEKGKKGEIYNVGSRTEKKNIDLASKILGILDRSRRLIQFIKDRPGHDYRYALNCSKVRKIGWKPKVSFDKGIRLTVDWYVKNKFWLDFKIKYLRSYWRKVYKVQ